MPLQRLFRRGLDRLVLEAMVGLVSREEYTVVDKIRL